MYDFNFVKAASLEEAVSIRAAADDGTYIAGGQTLIPTLKQRLASPSDVIDISGIAGLAGISVEGGAVTVGAMTVHSEVAASADVRGAIPALAELAGMIGDPAVRNRGTIGGSLANSDPAADYPAAVLGLGATIVTNSREIAADDYFLELFETALEDGEIIREVRFPVPRRAAYMKFPNPASRYAVVGVFIADFGPETNTGIRVAVTGAGPYAFRVADMEAALAADFSADAVAGISVPADNLNTDLHASAEYRASLVTTMARRAVAKITGQGR